MDNILVKSYINDAESSKTMAYIQKHFLFKKLLSELLTRVFRETPIILFGSYASESNTSSSDIDILVLEDANTKSVANSLKEFGERHGKNIQIQTMTQQDFEQGLRERDTLVLEIVKNHVILNNIPIIVNILWRHYHAVR